MPKALIIGPDFHYFNHSVERAFCALGYETRVLAYDNPVHPYNVANILRYKFSSDKLRMKEESRVLFHLEAELAFEEFEPDFVFLMNGGLNQAYIRENYLNDKGYLKKTGYEAASSMPFGRKLRYLWKPIVGATLLVAFFLWKPFEDLYYYIGAGVAFLLLILSVLDLVRIHNLQVQQPLPQFNKRGGDHNA